MAKLSVRALRAAKKLTRSHGPGRFAEPSISGFTEEEKKGVVLVSEAISAVYLLSTNAGIRLLGNTYAQKARDIEVQLAEVAGKKILGWTKAKFLARFIGGKWLNRILSVLSVLKNERDNFIAETEIRAEAKYQMTDLIETSIAHAQHWHRPKRIVLTRRGEDPAPPPAVPTSPHPNAALPESLISPVASAKDIAAIMAARANAR